MQSPTEPHLVKTEHGIWIVEPDSHLGAWLKQAGKLDIAEGEIAHFASHIPAGGTVIDAGACLGDHTATYAKLVGPTGTVLAFEPGWLTYQALWRNFEAVPQVKCFHAALGMHEGRACHTLAENVGGSHIANDGEDNVEMTTIDALLLARLDFCHIDAEGCEPDIIRGGLQTLRRCRPVMVIEINKGALARFGHKDEDVYRALAEAGYGWRELFDFNNREMEQRDILAIPQ